MAFQSREVLLAVKTLMQGIAGVQSVKVGVVEGFDRDVSVMLCIGGGELSPLSYDTDQRDLSIYVGFYYRVGGDEEAAELTICDWLDALLAALALDDTLGGACYQAKLDLTLANQPSYEPVAGMEYRVYPARIVFNQTSD